MFGKHLTLGDADQSCTYVPCPYEYSAVVWRVFFSTAPFHNFPLCLWSALHCHYQTLHSLSFSTY